MTSPHRPDRVHDPVLVAVLLALATGLGVYAVHTYAQVAGGQEYLRLPSMLAARSDPERLTEYASAPPPFWLVKLMDRGIIAPLAVATGYGLLTRGPGRPRGRDLPAAVPPPRAPAGDAEMETEAAR